jgi:predicted RNA binding protein YcfA (HicA-like mRNA interferase family)
MPKLPIISGKEFIDFLVSLDFVILRTKGSHYRLRNDSGKYVTVPVHGNKELPKGLLRKIIREDLKMDLDEFIKIYNQNK